MFERIALHIPSESPGRVSFVAELEIPTFSKPPEVIIWGSRIFTLRLNNGHPGKLDHKGRRIYFEAFAYAAIPENDVPNGSF